MRFPVSGLEVIECHRMWKAIRNRYVKRRERRKARVKLARRMSSLPRGFFSSSWGSPMVKSVQMVGTECFGQQRALQIVPYFVCIVTMTWQNPGLSQDKRSLTQHHVYKLE